MKPLEQPVAVRFVAEGDGPPFELRLRRLLKCAIRGFGLRCIDFEQAPEPADSLPAAAASAVLVAPRRAAAKKKADRSEDVPGQQPLFGDPQVAPVRKAVPGMFLPTPRRR